MYEEPFVINRIIGRKRGESSLALLGIPKYFSQTILWPILRIFEFMATRNSVKIFFLKPIKRWLGWKLLTNLCWEKRSTVHWGLPIKPFWVNSEIQNLFLQERKIYVLHNSVAPAWKFHYIANLIFFYRILNFFPPEYLINYEQFSIM